MLLEEAEVRFECVQPLESHCRQVMDWRNDPVVLNNSFHTTPKVWERFWPEFCEEYFPVDGLAPLFALINGQRAAFLRFRSTTDPQGKGRHVVDISIIVAPQWRGKGVATAVLSACQPWVRARGYDGIYAEIKTDNVASLKAFTRAGFHHLDDAIKCLPDVVETYSIHRCYAPLCKEAVPEERAVLVIAEAGANWRAGGTPQEDRDMAFRLIDAAAQAGADCVKFQVYRPETIYAPNAGSADYLSETGLTQSMEELYAHLAMPYDLIPELAKHCDDQGIEFMASPFSAADFAVVDPYVKRHKIASYEVSHLRLLQLAGKSGKPLILSTGAAVEEDIDWAIHTFKQAGGTDLTLLQCTASYPADPDSLNLLTIPWLQSRFQCPAGLSDHSTHPLHAPVAAVALGAKVIEKHYTMDRTLPGPDHPFAIEPNELKALCDAVREVSYMRGDGVKAIHQVEQELRSFARRGVQAIRDIAVGEELREGVNIDILRPGKQSMGLHPRFLSEIEGKTTTRAIAAGAGITTKDI